MYFSRKEKWKSKSIVLIADDLCMVGVSPNLVGVENHPSPYTCRAGHFLVVLQQFTNHNIKTANQISMKFCADIICWIETCSTIKSYSPGGATFPDCFASFSNLVAVTTVARSEVFPPNWASMRPYC